jgi:AraC family transcriptional regulator
MVAQVKPAQPMILTKAWEGITVEYGRLNEVGDFDFAMPKRAISVAFAPHDRVTWSVDGGSRQTTALPAGSVFLYSDRQFVWHQRQQSSEYVNLTLDDEWLQQIAAAHGFATGTFSAEVQLSHRVIFADPTILHVAQLLATEVQHDGMAGTLYVESLRNLLAVHLLRHYNSFSVPTKLEDGAIDPWHLQQVKDYIEANLAEDLTIAMLAALIPMSQFHFARAFKAATGEPPHRYITQRRIAQAKLLLSVTQLSIAEIVYRVGFSNQSHFTAQFRKFAGATPRQYRDCC